MQFHHRIPWGKQAGPCRGGDPCWWSQNHHISRSLPIPALHGARDLPTGLYPLGSQAGGLAGVAWAHSWGRQGRRHPAVQRELPRASLISAAADFPSPKEGRLPEDGCHCSLPGLRLRPSSFICRLHLEGLPRWRAAEVELHRLPALVLPLQLLSMQGHRKPP